MIFNFNHTTTWREIPQGHGKNFNYQRFLALALICVLLLCSSMASADDWSTDCFSGHYRTYVNGTSIALTDYQVKYVLSNVSGTNSAENIYLPDIMQPDYNDIRFALSDGTTLNYWMETPTGTNSAIFWVKVPTIPAGSENSVPVDIYYGNASIGSDASGDATFSLFDNFDGSSLDTTTWSSVGTGTPGVSNSVLTLPSYAKIQSNIKFNSNAALRFYGNIYGYTHHVGYKDNLDTSNYIYIQIQGSARTIYLSSSVNSESKSDSLGINLLDKYQTMELLWNSTDSELRNDTGALGSINRSVVATLPVYLGSQTSRTSYYDWVFVRQLADTEPAMYQPGTPPVAGFNTDVTNGDAPLVVHFTDASTNMPTTWAWDFNNDGITDSTAPNPTYTFSVPGTFTVALTVTNDAGSTTETKTDLVTVTTPSPPTAGFSADTVAGTSPFTVHFTDESAGVVTEWAWDFGDSDTTNATRQNPVHTYHSAGTYPVALTVTNAGGSNSTVKPGYITVADAGSGPVAAFAANRTTGTPPLAVVFTDASTGTITGWTWDFQDDGVPDATTQDAVHIYSAPGTYTVNLTVTGPEGDDSEIKTGFITVTSQDVDLTVSAVPATGSSPNPNLFAHYTANPVSTSITNSGTQNVGQFNVTFDISGNSTSVTVAALGAGNSTVVSITDPVDRPVGASVPIIVTADTGNEIAETNETNNQRSYTATAIYNGYAGHRWSSGNDIITMKVFNIRGDTIFSLGDSVYGSDSVSWTAANLPVPDGATIKDARLYVPYTWDWEGHMLGTTTMTFNGVTVPHDNHYREQKDWGTWQEYAYGVFVFNVTSQFRKEGNSAVFSHEYAPVRGMNLVVTYEDATATEKQIFINEEFDMLFASSSYYTTPETATAYAPFTGADIDMSRVKAATLTTSVSRGSGWGTLLFNGSSYPDYWLPGAGEVGIQSTDITPYLAATNNVAMLRCEDTTKGIEAYLAILKVEYQGDAMAPVAAFSADTTSGTTPLTVRFTDASTGTPTSWSWDFGDGDSTNATERNPVHTFTAAGTYSVELTVSNIGGSDNELKTGFITVTDKTSFTATPVISIAPLSVSFTDTSTNAPTAWVWESRASGTDDSWTTFSTEKNATASFAAGAYDIRLTTTSSEGSNTVTKLQYLSASAGPKRLATVQSGTVSGDLYVGAYGGYSSGTASATNTLTQTFTIPAYSSIQWARLYTVVMASGTDNRAGTATITFDGDGDGTFETTFGTETLATAATSAADVYPVNDHVNRQYSDYMIWYNIGGLISSQNPAARVVSTPVSSNFDGRIKELALVVAYNDTDSDVVHYWVNEGHDYQLSSSSAVTTTMATNNLAPGWTGATLTNVALSSADASYTINGNTVTGQSGTSLPFFETNVWDARNYLSAGSDSDFIYSHASGKSFKTTLATLAVKYQAVPIAVFGADPISGQVPLTVQFSDFSENNPATWLWNFGDGNTSTARNPSHTYAKKGNYTVNLTVSNAAGSNSNEIEGFITVASILAPTAAFSANKTTGDLPISVKFTDKSTNSPTSWAWDFGDGNSSVEQNPVHTFTAARNYTIRLTVENTEGSNSITKTDYIAVIAPTIVQNNFTISGVQTTNGGSAQNVSIDTTLATVTTTGNTVNMTNVGSGWDHLEILMTDTPENGGTTLNGTVATVKAVTEPVTAPIASVGTPVVQIELALEEIPGSAAAITQTITKDPDATAQSAFVLAASSSGKQIDEIAYTLNVAKTNLANCCDGGTIKNATILMTVSPAWVSAHGGTDHIVIMRRADDGSTQFLTTQLLGSDSSGNYVFSALSPNGLSTFAMASVSTTSSGGNGSGGDSTSGGSGGGSSSGGSSSVSTGKGSSVLDFIVGALSSYSGIQTTYITDKGTYEITPLTADLDTMTGIKASWKAEIAEKPDGGGKITTSILKKLPDSMLSDYGTTLGKEGLAVNTVAYSMVISEVGITETKNAHVEMTASREWVSQNGGISQIRILRMDDYGNTEILNTAFSRYDRDNGYIAFEAESPRGLCTFTLLGVKTGSGSPGQLSGSTANLPVTEEIPRNASEVVPSSPGISPVWIITGFVIITGSAAIAVVSKMRRKKDDNEKD